MQHATNRRLKILLVDDDPFVHEILGSFISEKDYSLVSVTNVADAMGHIMNERPDLIITDALMPAESGFSLINKIKADPLTANIPIVLMTILEQPDGSMMDATGQADFRVSKPLYLPDISSTLELAKQLLNRRRAMVVHFSETREPFMIAI